MDKIMQKIRSRVLMDRDKHISGVVQQVENLAVWTLNWHLMNQ